MVVAEITLIVTVALPLLVFLFRKRLLRAFGRLLWLESVAFVRSTYFVEADEEVNGETKRVLRPSAALQSLSSAVAPMLLQTALKSIKLKAPANLPINPITGQLDFMAPVLGKIASGKKVGFEDFLPLIMDKAMPFIEGFLGGKGGKKPSETESTNPFLKQ